MCGELEAVMDRAYGAMVASEEFWTAVLRTAATRADRGSVNSIASAAQCPHATRVLSSGDWRKAGRFPAKGSTSIRMWTLIKRRTEGAQDATAATADAGQREAASDAASAAHVAALILGITPGPAVMPPLAGIITHDKKPPVHESAVRAIETGRAVRAAAEHRRELAVTG